MSDMIKRNLYLKKLEMYVDKDAVKIITGVRSCGKTTLIHQFIDELKEGGIPEDHIFYVNFEGVLYSYFTKTEDLRDLAHMFLESVRGEHCYIFLDEPGQIENWAQVAAELLNLCDCDLYVISSNAGIFYDGFAKTLDYRYVRIDVYPFTFSEYMEMLNPGAVPSSADFSDYLRRGAMPAVYSIADDNIRADYLFNLYNTIVLKEVVQKNKLRDIYHLDKIMEYVLTHVGETFSPKTVRDHVRSNGIVISVDTVYSFLDALTDSFLLYKVPRFDIKSDRELETQEKYYVCDMAMRNAAVRDEGASLESLLENAVFLELMSRGFKVYAGKYGGCQIDFMGVKGGDRTYLNCCLSVAEKEEMKKNFTPLQKIRDNYFKMVLSMDEETMVNKGGIINYPVIRFLSQV